MRILLTIHELQQLRYIVLMTKTRIKKQYVKDASFARKEGNHAYRAILPWLIEDPRSVAMEPKPYDRED